MKRARPELRRTTGQISGFNISDLDNEKSIGGYAEYDMAKFVRDVKRIKDSIELGQNTRDLLETINLHKNHPDPHNVREQLLRDMQRFLFPGKAPEVNPYLNFSMDRVLPEEIVTHTHQGEHYVTNDQGILELVPQGKIGVDYVTGRRGGIPIFKEWISTFTNTNSISALEEPNSIKSRLSSFSSTGLNEIKPYSGTQILNPKRGVGELIVHEASNCNMPGFTLHNLNITSNYATVSFFIKKSKRYIGARLKNTSVGNILNYDQRIDLDDNTNLLPNKEISIDSIPYPNGYTRVFIFIPVDDSIRPGLKLDIFFSDDEDFLSTITGRFGYVFGINVSDDYGRHPYVHIHDTPKSFSEMRLEIKIPNELPLSIFLELSGYLNNRKEDILIHGSGESIIHSLEDDNLAILQDQPIGNIRNKNAGLFISLKNDKFLFNSNLSDSDVLEVSKVTTPSNKLTLKNINGYLDTFIIYRDYDTYRVNHEYYLGVLKDEIPFKRTYFNQIKTGFHQP